MVCPSPFPYVDSALGHACLVDRPGFTSRERIAQISASSLGVERCCGERDLPVGAFVDSSDSNLFSLSCAVFPDAVVTRYPAHSKANPQSVFLGRSPIRVSSFICLPRNRR